MQGQVNGLRRNAEEALRIVSGTVRAATLHRAGNGEGRPRIQPGIALKDEHYKSPSATADVSALSRSVAPRPATDQLAGDVSISSGFRTGTCLIRLQDIVPRIALATMCPGFRQNLRQCR